MNFFFFKIKCLSKKFYLKKIFILTIIKCRFERMANFSDKKLGYAKYVDAKK